MTQFLTRPLFLKNIFSAGFSEKYPYETDIIMKDLIRGQKYSGYHGIVIFYGVKEQWKRRKS